MKKSFILFMITISSHSFAYTVVDSLYEPVAEVKLFNVREPSSQEGQFCLVDSQGRKFAKNCYSNVELCEKRFAFWNDLPGVKLAGCAKI